MKAIKSTLIVAILILSLAAQVCADVPRDEADILKPSPGSKLTLADKNPDGSITFKWTAVDGAIAYVLAVGTEPRWPMNIYFKWVGAATTALNVSGIELSGGSIYVTWIAVGLRPQCARGYYYTTLSSENDASAMEVVAKGSTTERNLAERFADVINVKDYGAKGDGVTDDTAAIQAAIDAAEANGRGVVYLAAGNYIINAELTVESSNIWIQGAGPGLTTIWRNTDGRDGIVVGDGSTPAFQVQIRDLKITTYGFTPSGGAAIKLYGPSVSGCHIENVHISAPWIGIRCIDANPLSMYKVTIHHPAVGGTGIRIEGDGEHNEKNTLLDHVFIQGTDGPCPYAGVHLVPPISAVRIVNSDIIAMGTGILIDGNSGGSKCHVGSVWVINTFIDKNREDGIRLAPLQGQTFSRIKIIDNWISGLAVDGSQSPLDGKHGVMLDSSGGGYIDGVDIIGNTMLLNGEEGIKIAADSADPIPHISNINIMNNNIAGNNRDYLIDDQAEHAGIAIDLAANFRIISNRIGKSSAVKNYQTAGIEIHAGVSDYYEIIGNDLTGNTLAGLRDDGSGINKKIAMNIGYVTENSGSAQVGTGETTVDVTHGLAAAPTRVQLTPTSSLNNASYFWVDTIGATKFTIHLNANPGTDVTFDWRAVIGEGN